MASDREPALVGQKFSGGLYLVATPIGNARDITLRALDLLKVADVIACEDTRVTGRLLAMHGLGDVRHRGQLLSYHEHNADKSGPQLIEHLENGEIVALLSDAGTPLISDPGYRLVNSVRDLGISVFALPGPSALLAALTSSGMATDRFLFAGFPPVKSQARRKFYAELENLRATLIFYETAPRLQASLRDMAAVFGDRDVAVARELTKFYEEVRRDRLTNLQAHYEQEGPPKGELVIVVGADDQADETWTEARIYSRLETLLEDCSTKDAATQLAKETGMKRKLIYELALQVLGDRDEPS